MEPRSGTPPRGAPETTAEHAAAPASPKSAADAQQQPARVSVFDFSDKISLSSAENAALRGMEASGRVSGDSARSRRGDHDYKFLDAQPHAQLSSGAMMPLVGLGTWKSEPGQLQAAVECAVRAGYRHIDCAYVYENEHEVGTAIRNIIAEGVVQREDLFITSKLWNKFHGQNDVEPACRRSLDQLGLTYLDLYLVHWPHSGQPGATLVPPYAETWGAMEQLVHNGLVRSIGVSNLSAVKLDALLKDCTIRPAVNQVEMHPFFRNDELLAYCKEQGVHVTAYSPLGSPDSADVIKRRYTPSLLSHPVVTRLAEKHGRNPGQVLVQWAVQRGTSVLPKSVTPKRIVGNIDVIGWRLEQQDMEELSSFELQVRLVDGSFWVDPRGPYKTLNELWDRPDEDERQQRIVAASYTNLGGVINGVPMPVAKLNSGYSMPLVGLGTWKAERGEVRSAVEAAIRMGYRHIDCANVYQNEDEVGEALEVIRKEGVVNRDELFVTSKLWNTEHLPSQVIEACRRSLKALQLEYLDLYLVHWPASGPPEPGLVHKYTATWIAMEELVQSGLVRSIGVSNLSVVKLDALLQECAICPAVNQVEAHPYWRNDHLRAFCATRDVHVTAYSPLGSPDSAAVLGRPADVKGPMHNPVVAEVAEHVGRSPAQVLLRWGLQRGTSVLPKSVHVERLAANLDIVGWELPEECFHKLSCLATQMRMVPGTHMLQPKGPYRNLRELWDEEDPVGEAPNKM